MWIRGISIAEHIFWCVSNIQSTVFHCWKLHIHLHFELFPPWPQYFESLLQEVEEETERECSLAIEKALSEHPKLLKLQKKLDKGIEQKKFLDEVGIFDIYPCVYSANLLI